MEGNRVPHSIEFEMTARCNNNCRHCYVNLPAGDKEAQKQEVTFEQVRKIADEAAQMGFLWWVLTGGEPLLREDFFDIYLMLRKKGFLVALFTNATLIREKHVRFFKEYPPRNIDVTVYGISRQTYERVTRVPGSFKNFKRGLDLLEKNNIPVRLKSVAMRSNFDEFPQIIEFCKLKSSDFFRLDPFLHLRSDGNRERNRDILSERLSPEEIIKVEQLDPERVKAVQRNCGQVSSMTSASVKNERVFRCGVGNNGFALGCDGFFRLCLGLRHKDFTYDLKKGTLNEAWHVFVPKVVQLRSRKKAYLEACGSCKLFNLCMCCPVSAYLETGEMDVKIDYFCKLAQTRLEKFSNCNRLG